MVEHTRHVSSLISPRHAARLSGNPSRASALLDAVFDSGGAAGATTTTNNNNTNSSVAVTHTQRGQEERRPEGRGPWLPRPSPRPVPPPQPGLRAFVAMDTPTARGVHLSGVGRAVGSRCSSASARSHKWSQCRCWWICSALPPHRRYQTSPGAAAPRERKTAAQDEGRGARQGREDLFAKERRLELESRRRGKHTIVTTLLEDELSLSLGPL